MKRRKFIAATSLATIGLPVAYYTKKRDSKRDPLTTAGLLSHFCDERELKEIGTAYRSLVPSENKKQKLTNLIHAGADGSKLNVFNWSGIEDLLAKSIYNDFFTRHIIIVREWSNIQHRSTPMCNIFANLIKTLS